MFLYVSLTLSFDSHFLTSENSVVQHNQENVVVENAKEKDEEEKNGKQLEKEMEKEKNKTNTGADEIFVFSPIRRRKTKQN